MCFDTDSSPPIPVIKGAAVSHEDVVLEAADGNHFAAFAALSCWSLLASLYVVALEASPGRG